MPLFLEDEANLAGTFDVQTANTLFWKTIPVLVKQNDREDQVETLTFRILTGGARHNHNLRVLRVYISSEGDPFFLHTLEVSEEDFQTLKVEQGILVDFSNFPTKIISLLERCITSQRSDMPRFQAVLQVRAIESVFKVMETNDFKQLPHISLSFRPGNDTAVKQFLAFRLVEVKGNCKDLSEELSQVQADCDRTHMALAETRQQLLQVKEQHDKHVREVDATTKTQQAAAQEERLREKAVLQEQAEREKHELETKYKQQVEALTSRMTELDSENRKLRDTKYELDTKVSELSHKLGAAEGSNRSLETECDQLRAQNKKLSSEKHDLDILLNESKAKLAAAEEKVQSQSQSIDQHRLRVKDLEAATSQWEERCNDLKHNLLQKEAQAKEAATEVMKGNQIIEKLTSDLRLAKEKVKRKQAIIVRQEEELVQREQSQSNDQREIQALTKTIDNLRQEIGQLKAENQELKAKVDDSKQQLESNEQMIRWLNQQVTEAQLQVSTGVTGSRYQFRPAATTTAGGAAGMLGPSPAQFTSSTRYTTPPGAGTTTAYKGYQPSMYSSKMSPLYPRAGENPGSTISTRAVDSTVPQ